MLFERKPYSRHPVFANQGTGSAGDAYEALIDGLSGGEFGRIEAAQRAEEEREDECRSFLLEARRAYAQSVEDGIRSAHAKGENPTQVKILSEAAKGPASRALDAAEDIAVARYGEELVAETKRDLGFE